MDPADFLASFDGSGDLPSYRSALDAWQAECQQNRAIDAGYVNSVYRIEKAHNTAEKSRLVVMRRLTASVPPSARPTDCATVVNTYLTLNDSTHFTVNDRQRPA